jgi:hypothetical protein
LLYGLCHGARARSRTVPRGRTPDRKRQKRVDSQMARREPALMPAESSS